MAKVIDPSQIATEVTEVDLPAAASMAPAVPGPTSPETPAEIHLDLTEQNLRVFVEDSVVGEWARIFGEETSFSVEQKHHLEQAVRKRVRFELRAMFEGELEGSAVPRALELLGYHFEKLAASLTRLQRLQSMDGENKQRIEDEVRAGMRKGDFSGVDKIGVKRFLELLKQVVQKGKDLFDGASLGFKDLRFVAHSSSALPKELLGPETVRSSFRKIVLGPLIKIHNLVRPPQSNDRTLLQGISGSFSHSKITLVLGPPGAGKTTLFSALSGRLKTIKGKQTLSGRVLLESHDVATLHQQNFISMVGQLDEHLATLTTRETIGFAHQCRQWDVDRFRSLLSNIDDRLDTELAKKNEETAVDLMLAMLGLQGAADTIIGDETVKGVSGGEKRRVTLGEMLISKCPVVLLDEISTGLDSAATLDITKTLRTMARLFKTCVVVALLQPPPETYELFDEVLLLDSGHIMYRSCTPLPPTLRPKLCKS